MSAPQTQVLQHLCSLSKSSPEFSRSLYAFIRLDEKGEYSRDLQQSDSARLVNFLDGALDVIPVTDPLFRRCLRRLRIICGHHNVLPTSHIVGEGLEKTSEGPVAFGGFADVWEGSYEGRKVCVKALRIYNPNTSTNGRNNSLAPFYGEAVVWKRLKHPNVVQFLGVTTMPLQIVLEWMPNGTLTAHINSHPQVDRMSLLLDVAEGVNYLHTCHMLHGDLKGPNILIDAKGHARVSDFGLASVVQGKFSKGVKSDKGHTVRWSAPEVLFGVIPASKQADMFAFGMVVVEVFTGKVPFHNAISTAVSYKTMSGERPSRPRGAETLGLSDSLWKMTEFCWHHSPKDRLKASEVVDLLREMYATSPTNPVVDLINDAQGLAGSSPTTPQTDAAISPKLLDILRYREPTNGHTLSGAVPLNSERRKATGNLPESPTSHQFGVDQGRNVQHFAPQFGSETHNTVESDIWGATPSETLPMIPTTLHQQSLDREHKPVHSLQDMVEIPDTSAQTGNSIHSETSSFTVVDGPVSQQPAETNHGVAGGRDGQEDNGMRNGLGTEDVLPDHGNGDARSPSSARGPSFGEPNRDIHALLAGSSGRDRGPRSRSGPVRNERGLLSPSGLGSGSSNLPTAPGNMEGDSKGEENGESPLSDMPPHRTGSAKKGPSGWGRIRGVAKVVGLRKQVQSQHNDSREK